MGRGRLDTGERIVKKRERTKAKRRKRRRKKDTGYYIYTDTEEMTF